MEFSLFEIDNWLKYGKIHLYVLASKYLFLRYGMVSKSYYSLFLRTGNLPLQPALQREKPLSLSVL